MEAELIKLLFENGLIGIILGWFMFRNEKKIDALTKALETNTQVMNRIFNKLQK